MSKQNLSGSDIYKIYEQVMGQDVHHLEKKSVRQFARAVIEADRAIRSDSKCECELGSVRCKRCGLVGGCSPLCEAGA